MQVICHGGRSALSTAEDAVVRLLQGWSGQYHLPGVYLANVHVPTGAKTRQIDGLLWTPYGLTAVEIKGFTAPQAGTVEIPANGAWTVDGQPAALHTQAEANPTEQCHTAVYAVKNALQKAEVDPGYITGLICLVPPRHRQLRLSSTSNLPGGITAALATRRDLRRWAHRQRDRQKRAVWSADDIRAAATALDLGELLPERATLIADGIPDVITHSTRPRQHRPNPRRSRPSQPHSSTTATAMAPPSTTQQRPRPAPPTAPPAATPSPPVQSTRPAPAPAAWAQPPRGPRSRTRAARPPRRRQSHAGSVLVLLTLVLTLGVTVGLLAASLHT